MCRGIWSLVVEISPFHSLTFKKAKKARAPDNRQLAATKMKTPIHPIVER
jgi:hypothetical protein